MLRTLLCLLALSPTPEASRAQFHADKRLDTKIEIDSSSLQHSFVWSVLNRRANVTIEVDPSEKQLTGEFVYLACRGLSARALMDAIAARRIYRWELLPSTNWKLLNSEWEMDFAFGGDSQAKRERCKHGAEFIKGLKELSKQDRNRLLSGEKFRFDELNPTMKRHLSSMMETMVADDRSRNLGLPFQLEKLPEAELTLQRRPADGFNLLWMTVKVPSAPNTSSKKGFSFNDYLAEKESRNEARRNAAPGGLDPIYTTVRHEINHKESKELPELKQRVSIVASGLTLPEVIGKLSGKYKISFVCDPTPEFTQRAAVDLQNVTLGEALDRLTRIYKETEWEWRKLGFLIIRSPRNSVRHAFVPVNVSEKLRPQLPTTQKRDP